VQIAPYCCFYPYNHGFAPGELIKKQPLRTKGGIIIDDDAWLGVGVLVLDGVRIGKGAVIGAGSVVTGNIPNMAIATGIPARVVKMRSDLVKGKIEEQISVS
jgi:acetyltransferase-like isoleucine patch superfamily enzyme